jgi:LysM repeat protein
MLAPIALVAFAFVLIIVIASSGTSEDSDENGDQVSQQQDAPTTTTPGDLLTEPRVEATFYTVKTGDTLGGIAETVGVSITRLQELNPELDPQALVSGQKIRLRE